MAPPTGEFDQVRLDLAQHDHALFDQERMPDKLKIKTPRERIERFRRTLELAQFMASQGWSSLDRRQPA